jgi:hypothetical protein
VVDLKELAALGFAAATGALAADAKPLPHPAVLAVFIPLPHDASGVEKSPRAAVVALVPALQLVEPPA